MTKSKQSTTPYAEFSITTGEKVTYETAKAIEGREDINIFKIESDLHTKELNIIKQALINHPNLTELDFNNNTLADEGSSEVAEILEKNNRLVSLKINFNGITPKGAKLIAESIVSSSSLTHLDISMNCIKDEGLQEFAKALNKSSLKYINLGCNEGTAEGLSNILQALQENNTLESIDLTRTSSKDESQCGAENLAQLLRTNTRLKKIDLTDNDINNEGAQKIMESLRDNTTLTYLELHANTISSEINSEIQSFISRNRSLLHDMEHSQDMPTLGEVHVNEENDMI